MAIQQSSFFCPVCQQQRLFTRQRSVNHVLHLLIMVFTCGLWAIVWAILILTDNPRFHCAQCGYSDSNKYLANPYLRSQEAQLNAERATLRGESSSSSSNPLTDWFSGLNSQAKRYLIYGAVTVGLLFIGIGFAVVGSRNNNRQSNGNANASNDRSSNNAAATPIKSRPLPSTLSPAENLEEAQKALSEGEAGEGIAVMHLSAIPKDAKEYATAKRLLDKIAASRTPEQKEAAREGAKAYKIGYKQGCIKNGLEVKNTAQVDILADTAADLVHRPKYEALWKHRWAEGFIEAYNKCHPSSPIRTMSGEVAGR